MSTATRPSRAAIRFSGPDAPKLLFDVLTPRLVPEEGPAHWWALLSPQGKIQAEGLGGWVGGAFWLDVAATDADAFLKRMRIYRLRAAVEIDDLRATHSVGWTDGDNIPGIGLSDPRAGGLGTRFIVETASTPPPDEAPFRAARIATGIAEQGEDFAPDAAFPHDIGMDLLGGIDFRKGCYIGQEVVSRMQHRGTARRRPVIVSGIDAPAGTPVLAGEREVGTIGAGEDGHAVAILRLDRFTDPPAATVGGRPVTLALPAWAPYRFGESAGAE